MSEPSTPLTIEQLRDENSRLKKEISVLQENVKEKEIKIGGSEIGYSDYETLKGFFSIFDENKDGSINLNEFASLHHSLGEPITLEEAKELQKQFSKHEDGSIEMNEFIKWWVNGHKGLKSSSNKNLTFKTTGIDVTNCKNDFDLKNVVTEAEGTLGSLDYRLCFYYNGVTKERMSPWHDVPLYVLGEGKKAKILHMFCEIPKWTRAKFEVATRELYNPFKQDVKNGKVRYYQYGDMLFNYGAFPQTWENPNHISHDTNAPGDNDPIDAIEIGTKQIVSGGIVRVKVLGVLGMIDDGETDWKVICIQTSDPLSQILEDVNDVEKHLPGAIDAIREWLRVYKVCSGNEPNTFAFDGKCLDREYALGVIEETHVFWKKLRQENKDVVCTPLPTSQRKFENYWTTFDPEKLN